MAPPPTARGVGLLTEWYEEASGDEALEQSHALAFVKPSVSGGQVYIMTKNGGGSII